MKTAILTITALVITALSMPSYAHDPKEHQKQGATAPDCSKMKEMDAGKIDKNDPVMKALYAKCKKQLEYEGAGHDHTTSAAAADKGPAKTTDSTAQKPGTTAVDCSKMKNMDMSKMDMNDPAMKALHERCMKQKDHAQHDDAAHKSGVSQKQAPASGASGK